jgi:cobaltochelatase CobS
MAQSVEKLQEIIATSTNAEAVEMAKKQLERLTAMGAAQVQIAATSPSVESPELATILDTLRGIVSKGGVGAGKSDIRDIVLEELSIRKINYDDLSESLKALLESFKSTRKVQLTISSMGVSGTTSTQGDSMLDRKIVQLLLSDVEARNNAYLYGGAGTGKTFIANYLAELLGWKAITLNCNQYTSPLDIIGGQTIEGYQEGKLSIAWSNKEIVDGQEVTHKGCVLILDELPKIDPNTAGILNEALAKVKQFKEKDGVSIPPTIMNGKNQVLTLGNLFVIGTGNVALNTIDPDYEANFKQDLSLQDRFIGSTYKVFVDYEYEFNVVMKGFAFIWLFGVKLREALENVRATGQAFVSLRLMENMRSTYIEYRRVMMQNKSLKTSSIISNPKTIVESVETVFALVKEAQRKQVMDAVDFKGFIKIVEAKNKMAFDPTAPNFDTAEEIAEAQVIIKNYEERQKISI